MADTGIKRTWALVGGAMLLIVLAGGLPFLLVRQTGRIVIQVSEPAGQDVVLLVQVDGVRQTIEATAPVTLALEAGSMDVYAVPNVAGSGEVSVRSTMYGFGGSSGSGEASNAIGVFVQFRGPLLIEGLGMEQTVGPMTQPMYDRLENDW